MKNRWISWPGAKFRQLNDIFEHISFDYIIANYNHICEPYLGAGAFSLQFADQDFYFSWAEKNPMLRLWWNYLLYDPELFIDRMAHFREKYADASNSQEVYNEMRAYCNTKIISQPEDMDTAALLWCLIYQSTNNLARFNKKGEYNQTWGRGRKVPDPYTMFTEDAIKDIYNINAYVNMYESDVELFADFKQSSKNAWDSVWRPDSTIVYLDPPYILRTEVYDKDWDLESEKIMFEYLEKLDKYKIAWFMTNYLSVEKDGETIWHPFMKLIEDKKWIVIPLDHKLDTRPTNKSNNASEYIIVGKNKDFIKEL